MLGIRLFLIGIVSASLIGAGAYVFKLRADNAILKANEQQVELRKSTMMTQEEALAFRGELQTAVFETESLNNAFKANVVTT